MKHKIAGWFRRNNTLMAQAKDLQRQWQAMRDERDGWRIMYEGLSGTELYIRERLHSVARERDEERRLRLEAEKKHRDIVWAWSDKQIAEAAEELRDTYLENEEERDECV